MDIDLYQTVQELVHLCQIAWSAYERTRDVQDIVQPLLSRTTWNEVVTGQASLQGKILKGDVDVDGSRLKLLGFFSLLDDFDPAFNIVTP